MLKIKNVFMCNEWVCVWQACYHGGNAADSGYRKSSKAHVYREMRRTTSARHYVTKMFAFNWNAQVQQELPRSMF